jgi:hypothetical protein
MTSNPAEACMQPDALSQEPRYADFTRFEIELEVRRSYQFQSTVLD